MRHPRLALALASAVIVCASSVIAQSPHEVEPSAFDSFLQALWPDAQAAGVNHATFGTAFAGLMPDPRVIAATRKQPEFGKPVGAYVNAVASKDRIEAGVRNCTRWTRSLRRVERRFGVDRSIIVAIWGIETSYGDAKDHWDVIRSLATLAQAGYRHPYFRNELLIALQMLQREGIPRDKLVGSWAGAMGQPQFMPSDFMRYAIKFSGRGRGDIWTNVPDVLASTANYLHQEGWTAGVPWGFEVIVPNGFDYRRSRGSFHEWTGLGLKRADGGAFPSSGDAILFFPTGASGPAFLVTNNFVVIKRYNDSDVYALAVAHLADRLRGRAAIRTAWPPDDHQLSRDERIALQRKLAALGYAVHDFEGHIDFELRDAIRNVQAGFGISPDGHPTTALLDRLGAHPP